MPQRGLTEAKLAVDGVRDAERAEDRLERAANPVVARHDQADPLGRHPAAGEREHLLPDQLQRSAAAGAFEEPDRAVQRRRPTRVVREQRALEMGERRGSERGVARRQLLDPSRSESGEILGRSAQRGERRPGRLVGERDRYLRARSKRLEERPLRAGEILEAVGEDRLAVPRVEVGLQALDRVAAEQAAVPPLEPVELGAVAGVEPAELTLDRLRSEQPRLELLERLLERVDEAGPPCRACESVELRSADDAADDQRLLRTSQHLPRLRGPGREAAEHVVEGADRAAEERGPPRQQLELDAVDVRPVRHDEHRIGRAPGSERVEIAAEEEFDLARVGRPRDESERHPPTLALQSAREACGFASRG